MQDIYILGFSVSKTTPPHISHFFIAVNHDITVISTERHLPHNLCCVIKQKQLGNVGE